MAYKKYDPGDVMNKYLHFEQTSSISCLINEIDSIQRKIDDLKPFDQSIWLTIQEELNGYMIPMP